MQAARAFGVVERRHHAAPHPAERHARRPDRRGPRFLRPRALRGGAVLRRRRRGSHDEQLRHDDQQRAQRDDARPARCGGRSRPRSASWSRSSCPCSSSRARSTKRSIRARAPSVSAGRNRRPGRPNVPCRRPFPPTIRQRRARDREPHYRDRLRQRPRARGRRALTDDRARGDLCAGRRVGMRQVDDGAVDPAAAARCRARHRRYRRSRRHRHPPAARNAHARHSRPPHQHHLPGAVDEPQPGDDRRAPDHRGDRAPYAASRRRGRSEGGRLAEARRHSGAGAPDRRLPVPDVRRTEAARDDRDRAGRGTRHRDRRRADDRARRHDPGADPGSAARAPGVAKDGDAPHHARSGDRRQDGASRRADVCRTDRRSGRCEGVFRAVRCTRMRSTCSKRCRTPASAGVGWRRSPDRCRR